MNKTHAYQTLDWALDRRKDANMCKRL